MEKWRTIKRKAFSCLPGLAPKRCFWMVKETKWVMGRWNGSLAIPTSLGFRYLSTNLSLKFMRYELLTPLFRWGCWDSARLLPKLMREPRFQPRTSLIPVPIDGNSLLLIHTDWIAMNEKLWHDISVDFWDNHWSLGVALLVVTVATFVITYYVSDTMLGLWSHLILKTTLRSWYYYYLQVRKFRLK